MFVTHVPNIEREKRRDIKKFFVWHFQQRSPKGAGATEEGSAAVMVVFGGREAKDRCCADAYGYDIGSAKWEVSAPFSQLWPMSLLLE